MSCTEERHKPYQQQLNKEQILLSKRKESECYVLQTRPLPRPQHHCWLLHSNNTSSSSTSPPLLPFR
ncbi:hypothetical protein E2C01_026756 [Portunus trituberculatus]|uniref:Uncharacterized protein n=1 Tax=Portunus trituberculatus TaxID=210409 RepID=A0A5B7EJN0_PORTR|nr:hypothetical protein [Portunus trituberculatus]